MHDHLTGISS